MADGFSLNVDTSFLRDLEKADKAMEALLDKNEQLAKSTVQAFQKMSNSGVVPYLKELENRLNALNSIKSSIGEKPSSDMIKLSNNVSNAIDNINRLITTLKSTDNYKIAMVDELAKSLEKAFNVEQSYALRMDEIRSKKAKHVQEELNEYQQIIKKLNELYDVRKRSSEEINNPTNSKTFNAAKGAYSESLRQIEEYSRRKVELEKKYEVEIQVLYEQNAINRFKNNENEIRLEEDKRIKLAKEYEKELEDKRRAERELISFAKNASKRYTSDIQREEQQKVDSGKKEVIRDYQERFKLQEEELRRSLENVKIKREAEIRLNDERIAGILRANQLDEEMAQKAIKRNSEVRASLIARYKTSGDLSNNAMAAYERLSSGKGVLSVNNISSVLSKLQQAQGSINLKTKEGRDRYEELGNAIKNLQSVLNAVGTSSERNLRIAEKESQVRASLYRYIQSSGDTTKQSDAAYNRIYGDKGVQSVANFKNVLSSLELAQSKINQRTEEGRKKYDEFEVKINRVKQSIEDLSNRSKKAAQEEEKSNNDRIKSINDLLQAQSKYRAFMYSYRQRSGDTSNQATAAYNRLYGEYGVKSVNNMNRALQRLQDAQNKLNLNTDKGRQKYDELGKKIQQIKRDLDKATQANEKFHNSHSKLLNTTDQLQRKLALLFSISAIQGYMDKLVNVRKEFELQQKSLQVLLRDKDQADKLWQQTIDLAVKSPFRVSQLVSYTKQLAAYRIESDKLYDTTKMLSDVSAGLGVDMQRIILAFGQVRAANFLRGTELRQFTEAGIPMLDELAQMFTELEGRAVNAGDVFERISKRMVTFSDVEEVFTRMTNAGGVFYNMQEEQSTTLQGMISNLRDSIDLMLNDIGKANDGLLKGSVNAAKNFVENWKEVAFYMENAIKALAAWKIANAAFAIGTQNAATTTLWLNSALKANIGTSMINIKTLKWSEAALVGVTKQQWLLGKATLYLQGILRGIGKFAIRTIVPLAAIAGVIELYRHLTKASRQTKELQNALNEIYNEDSSNLERQTNMFKDLVERLKKVNVGSKEHKDIISQLNSQYGEYLGFLVTEKTTYDEIATSINSVIEALTQKAKAQTFEKSLAKIIESVTKDMNDVRMDIEKTLSNFGVVRKESGISIMPTTQEINDIFNIIDKHVKETNKELDGASFNKILSEYYGEDVIRSGAIEFSKIVEYSNSLLKISQEEEKLQQRLNGLYGDNAYSTKQMRDEMNALNEERKKALQEEKTRIGKEKIEYDYLVKKTRLEGKYQGLEQSVIDANVAKLQKTSETIRDINRRIIESTDELGAEAVDRVYITAQDASQGVNAIAESMAAGYKSMQEEIKNQNALKEAGTVHDEASLENATKMSKAYYKVLEIMGRLDLLKSKGDKKESAIKILNNRINLIKEINKEYEKLNEKFDATTAKEQVLNAYKDTFKKAFEGTGIKFSGLVIDKEKLKIEGEKSGQIFSEEMVKKMNDVIESGTYIRSVSDKFKDELKKDEGVVFQLYDDSTKKIINNTKDFQNAVGTVTIGWGHAIKDINEAAKYFGKTISEIEAQEIFDQDVDKHVQALNKVLNKYQDLILTQEQYDSLLNATFQGGGGMISSAISYAMDIDKGVKHFENLDIKLKKVGKTFEQEFGSDFISRFKNAETATERLALALETVGLTTVASGSNIDERLYNGMKKRSLERAKEFRGDLELVKLLHKAAVDVSQIDFTNIRGVIATLKELEPIAKKEGKEAELQLSKAISKLEAEVNLNLKVKEDKQLIDQIEDMFSGYEMSIELQKLNIPPDLAKQLFNIDALALPELKNKVVSMESKFVGTDMEEEYRKFLKKIDEMEEKAQLERLKKYSKYLVKAQSERVKIKLEEMHQLAEIEKLGFNETQKEQITQSIQLETKQKMDKAEWDAFKDTDLYVQMFEDLGVVSDKVLNDLKKRLIDIRGSLSDLSPRELKEVVSQLGKVTSEQISRNPFESLGDTIDKGVKALKRLKDEQNAYNDALKEQESTQSTIDSLQISIEEAKNKQKEAKATLESSIATKEQKEQAMAVLATSALVIVNNEKLLDIEIKRLAKQKDITEEAAKKLILTRAEVSELNKTANSVGAWGSTITDSVSQVTSMLENWGIDFGEEFEGVLSGVGQMFNSLESIDLTKPMSIITGATGFLAGLGNTFASIFGFGNKDKKKEKQIQREIKFVEDLERAYQKLEKAIDNAYSINTLQASAQAAKRNLDAQIASYNKMIAAEEDKKKTDKDRIKEWQLAIEDLIEQKAELDKELVSVATSGIMDDVLSASQEFTNAWLEAFNETGDGLSGLEENFKSTMLEMVKQQAAMLISQAYVDRWKNQLEQYINPDDLELSTDEAKRWVNAVTTSLPQLNEALERYFTAMQQAGVDVSGGTSGELSGLQRGIQGVTEETAQILEAYLNSIRFFVAEQNTYLAQIASSFGNTEMENPMVEQLRIIASQTTAINTLLQSLTRGGHTLGGVGLKVFIS